ncbi:MAG: DUF488 domain-containing protein [Ruminococcus sp.]|nr:DUF488 domain-containing protein [Ruminococcus sp.]
MVIYTSYFANLKNLPTNVIPISICGKAPDWYKGIQYKKFAPKYGFFMEWKQNHDNIFYVDHFKDEVLSSLTPQKVISDLQALISAEIGEDVWENPDIAIALICYEKPSDFCHRHLVAEWLTDNGYKCEEWQSNVQKG